MAIFNSKLLVITRGYSKYIITHLIHGSMQPSCQLWPVELQDPAQTEDRRGEDGFGDAHILGNLRLQRGVIDEVLADLADEMAIEMMR